jgi:nucleoside triphosphatase
MKNNKFKRGIEVVVGVIIVNSDGKILLAKSPKWRNKWTVPGGHIELGETIQEAALREAKEEVGLDLESSGIISQGELIGSKDFHRPAHFIYFDVLCKTGKPDVKIDNKELTGYKWFLPVEALRADLEELTKKSVNSYIKFSGKK